MDARCECGHEHGFPVRQPWLLSDDTIEMEVNFFYSLSQNCIGKCMSYVNATNVIMSMCGSVMERELTSQEWQCIIRFLRIEERKEKKQSKHSIEIIQEIDSDRGAGKTCIQMIKVARSRMIYFTKRHKEISRRQVSLKCVRLLTSNRLME